MGLIHTVPEAAKKGQFITVSDFAGDEIHRLAGQQVGDLVYVDDERGGLERLAIGSTGQLLNISSGGIPAWTNTITAAMTHSAGFTMTDNVSISFGTDNDIKITHRDLLAADQEVTGLIEGTSNHQGYAADSLVISNITNDGDIMMLVSDGGNSKEVMLANADVADLQLGHGMATVNIKTASGAITLTPGTDTLIENTTGLIVGHTVGITGVDVSEFQVLGTAFADASAILGRWAGASASATALQFIKSRETTIGSFTIVADNDSVGRIIFLPDDGVDYGTVASEYLSEVDDGSREAGFVGMAHVWKSMPGGNGNGIAEVMPISAAGALSVGSGPAVISDSSGNLSSATGSSLRAAVATSSSHPVVSLCRISCIRSPQHLLQYALVFSINYHLLPMYHFDQDHPQGPFSR